MRHRYLVLVLTVGIVLISANLHVTSSINTDSYNAQIDDVSDITFGDIWNWHDENESYHDYSASYCYIADENRIVTGSSYQRDYDFLTGDVSGGAIELEYTHYRNDSFTEYGFPITTQLSEPYDDRLFFVYAIPEDSFDEVGILLRYQNQTTVNNTIYTGGDFNNSAKFFTIDSEVYLAYQNNDNYEIVRYNASNNALIPVFDLRTFWNYTGYTYSSDIEIEGNRIYLAGGYHSTDYDEERSDVAVFDISGDNYTGVYYVGYPNSIVDLTITDDGFGTIVIEKLENTQYRYYISQIGSGPELTFDLDGRYDYISFISSEGDYRYVVGQGDHLSLITEQSGNFTIFNTISYSGDEFDTPQIIWLKAHEDFFVTAIFDTSNIAHNMVQFHFYDEFDLEELFTGVLTTEEAFINLSINHMILITMPIIVIFRKKNLKESCDSDLKLNI